MTLVINGKTYEAGELIAYVENLEKENAELKNRNAELKEQNNHLYNDLTITESENAELKLKLEALEGQTPWKDIKDKSEIIGKLTKAKEIIKGILEITEDYKMYKNVYRQANQFIKDCEVEK